VTFPFAVFDIDGTLVDSRSMIETCMDAAFVEAGLPPPGYEKTRRIIGLSLGVGLAQLAPDVDEAVHSKILEAYRSIFIARRSDPKLASPLYEGVTELLADLAARNWVLGIATGKSRRGLSMMIEQFGWERVFTTHWCADDGPGKPHPHMVIENMRAVGASPRDTIVIGDSEHDIAMARGAKTTALGVTWGFGTFGEMHDAGAHHIVDTMGDLHDALARFDSDRSL
jgi:phosphoglycolate phosphatase